MLPYDRARLSYLSNSVLEGLRLKERYPLEMISCFEELYNLTEEEECKYRGLRSWCLGFEKKIYREG